MIKLLYFVDSLGDGGGGGIQTLLFNIINKIDLNNFKIDFLVFDFGHQKMEDYYKEKGLSVYTVPNPSKNFIKCLRYTKKFFKKNHDYDIIHCNSSSKSAIPLKYAKKYNIPIRITHSHCAKFQTKNIILKFIGEIMMFFNSKYASDYFACSQPAKEWMFKHWYISKNKYNNVYIMNNAIQTDKYMFNKDFRINIRKSLDISENAIVIGTVARIRKQKNHSFMIDIMNHICETRDDVYLLIVGTGPLEDEIIEKTKALGLDKRVIFLGARSDVPQLLSAMDTFLMPSFMEGLPFAGVEAQAAGLKCVVSNNVSKELDITNNICFLDLKDDLSKWANCCINDVFDFERRIEINFELKKKGFDLEENIKELTNKYISLIK